MQISSSEQTTNSLWLGLLGLVAIFFFALLFETMRIEQEIQAAVNSILHNAGYTRIETDVRGRDVTLRGAVSSKAAIQRSLALSSGAEGVRVVHSALDVAPVRLPHLHIEVDEASRLVVGGELPHAVHIDMLIDQLEAADYAAHEFRVNLATETSEPDWLAGIGRLLKLCKEIKSLQIEVGASKVAVAGVLNDAAVYEAVVASFSSAAAEMGLEMVNRIATINP